jgi:resuscitation-promoting factor RpfA
MSTLRTSAFALTDAGALASLWPHVPAIGHLTHPRNWVARVGADHAAADVCLAAMWLVAAWVAVAITAGVAAALPGTAGRLGATVARVAVPRAVYRIVAGAAGLGVLVTPGLAAASAAPMSPTSASTPTPTPDWPTDSAVPTPQWPTDAARHPDRLPVPQRHRAKPAPAHRRAAARTVVVRAGDTLWGIAADHLPGRATPERVAAAWPRWYAANRTVIGDDPNLIVAGQQLRTPSENTGPSKGSAS